VYGQGGGRSDLGAMGGGHVVEEGFRLGWEKEGGRDFLLGVWLVVELECLAEVKEGGRKDESGGVGFRQTKMELKGGR
jgi:hypothetical protein